MGGRARGRKVPCGPINDLDEVFADPQVQARGMTVTVPHPLAARAALVASPMKFSATPVQLRRPPPLLGQHTDEVLAEFGLDAADRRAFASAWRILINRRTPSSGSRCP